MTGPRRWWAACCGAALALAAGGCDPTALAPEPSPGVACASPRIVVGEPVLGADMLTGVHQRIIAAGGAESVADYC